MKTQQQSLKTEKLNNGSMEKRLLTSMLGIFFLLMLLVLSINMATAKQTVFSGNEGVQYFQWKSLLNDSKTTLNYASVTYNPSLFDTVSAGKYFESYVWYQTYPDTWNEANIGSEVKYCNLKVLYSKDNGNTLLTLTDQNFTESLEGGKYFVRLYPTEAYYVRATCEFVSNQARNNSDLSMPIEFSIVEPTIECVSCQYYNWATDQIKINKAITLAGYTTTNLGYIKGLFAIFYEFLIMAFWVLMIILVMLAVGLIFYAIFWLYSYLTKHTKVN
jgi:hypothetical protein